MAKRAPSQATHALTAPVTSALVAGQPLSEVRWVTSDRLQANDYNPNRVAPPELSLLKVSILADGWTQPIVVRASGNDHYEIVDGFHRWTLSMDPEVAALTGGLVPIVEIAPSDTDQRMATIRHNRARGTHYVVRMADIVIALDEAGVDHAEIKRGLGMDSEELHRFLQRGKMIDRGRADDMSKSWRPSPLTGA